MLGLLLPVANFGQLTGAQTGMDTGRLHVARYVVPRDGTLAQLQLYIQNTAGNYSAGVYDVGAATPGALTKLWGVDDQAMPASFGTRVMGSPALEVELGQHLAVVTALSGAPTMSGVTVLTSAAAALATPALEVGGCSPFRSLSYVLEASMNLPATIPYSSLLNHYRAPFVVGVMA